MVSKNTLAEKDMKGPFHIPRVDSVVSDIHHVAFHSSVIWIHRQIQISLQCDLEIV